MIRVPKLTACCRISSSNSGPVNAMLVVRRHLLAFLLRQGRVEIALQVAGREAGVVLHFGREGQLTQGQGAGNAVLVGIGPLEDQGLEFRASGVNGGSPGSRAAADDNQFFRHGFGSAGVEFQHYSAAAACVYSRSARSPGFSRKLR